MRESAPTFMLLNAQPLKGVLFSFVVLMQEGMDDLVLYLPAEIMPRGVMLFIAKVSVIWVLLLMKVPVMRVLFVMMVVVMFMMVIMVKNMFVRISGKVVVGDACATDCGMVISVDKHCLRLPKACRKIGEYACISFAPQHQASILSASTHHHC